MDAEFLLFIKGLLIKETPLTTVQAGKLVKAVEDLTKKNDDLITRIMRFGELEDDYRRDIKFLREQRDGQVNTINGLRGQLANYQEGNRKLAERLSHEQTARVHENLDFARIIKDETASLDAVRRQRNWLAEQLERRSRRSPNYWIGYAVEATKEKEVA